MGDAETSRRGVRATADVVVYASLRAEAGGLLLDEALDGLRHVRALRDSLDSIEMRLLEAARDAGLAWSHVAREVYDREHHQWMFRRYQALGGTRRWPPGRPPRQV